MIGRLRGRTDLKTTRRYAHLAASIAKQAAERTAGIVADLLMKSRSDWSTTEANACLSPEAEDVARQPLAQQL